MTTPIEERRRMPALLAATLIAALAIALQYPASTARAAVSATLLAHYDFSATAGTTVPDASGNGNDAVILGAGASIDGDVLTLPGGASGSGAAYVEMPTGMFDGQDTLTINTWLRNQTGTGYYAAMFFGTTENLPSQYWLLNPATPTEGRFKTVITGSLDAGAPWWTEVGISPTDAAKGVAGPVTTADWQMYTTVITPTAITGYLDGEKVGTVATSRTVSDFGADLVAYIGRSSYGDPFYAGGVRDVAIYTEALSESQVSELYRGDLTDEEAVAADLAALTIPNLDDVRGNITLPTAGVNGSAIAWETSDAAVITATGEVTRPAPGASSVAVTLTATLSKGEATDTAVLVATVQPAPETADYEGYFFPYFEGESSTVGEEIYFATSVGDDPTSWKELNNAESVLQSTLGEQGIRDPFVMRSPEGDRFYMLSTDLNMVDRYGSYDFGTAQETGSRRLNVWESTDLVHWSDQRSIVVSSDLAGNTWAPEAYYDEDAGEYVVYWASNLYETSDTTSRDFATTYNRMMYVTTRDFVTFTEPQEWVDVKRGTGRGMIDATVVKDGDTYYRFIKDEATFDVRQERSTDLTATVSGTLPTEDSEGWQLVKEHIGVGEPNPWGGTFTQGEGPTVFEDNAQPGHWYMLIDQPSYHGGEGYMLFETSDIASGDWTSVPSAQLPSSARHGTVLPITADEQAALLAAYPDDAPAEYTITVDDAATGAEIPDSMYGVFFEDINWAADGGLYAELVRNRSFEFLPIDNAGYTGMTAWSTTSTGGGAGAATTVNDDERLGERNRTYLQVTLDNPDGGTYGVRNGGFDGVALEEGDLYDFSVFARTTAPDGTPLTVTLVDADGAAISDTLELTVGDDGWAKYAGVLTASSTTTSGRLDVQAGGAGTLRLDMVSLFPEDTYKGRTNGLRKDLAEKIEALNPGFIRFPGGCIVNVDSHLGYDEDSDYERSRSYQWKDTVGPVEERATNTNFWGYNQTYGLGYFEYFQFAEDIGALPVPVVPALMNGCGQSLRAGEWDNQELLDRHIQDALDLIEFARGDASTEWGALRASMGHPEPFELDRLEVGNEENYPVEFIANFVQFRDAIQAVYPDVMVISNSGPDDQGAAFDLHWEQNVANDVDMVDEHYYNSPSWFLQNNDRYDSYDREGPKVWVGEYASLDNRWFNALSEAAYMTGLERNADVVQMASYAPLLANASHYQWSPDMIWFDNDESWGSADYEVQKLFMNNVGDRVVPTDATGDVIEPTPIGGTVGLSTWATAARYDDVTVTDPEGGVILADDFSDGDADGWTSLAGIGSWAVTDGAYVQSSTSALNTLVSAPAFDAEDYDLNLKATKISGAEGFLIGFGVKDSGNFYWWNLGGWNNTRHVIEKATDGAKETLVAQEGRSLETGHEYAITISVRGTHVDLYLDGVLEGSFDDDAVTEPFAQVLTEDDATGDLILKVVNAQRRAATTAIDLGDRAVAPTAEMTQIVAKQAAVNTRVSTPVTPETSTVDGIASRFEWTFPGNSVTFLRISTAKVTGFAPPVDMTDVNVVQAGSAVPLKFSAELGGEAVTDPSQVEVAIAEMACGADPSEAGDGVAVDPSRIRYDKRSGQFVLVWKTDKKAAGTCYAVTATVVGAPASAGVTALFELRAKGWDKPNPCPQHRPGEEVNAPKAKAAKPKA
ncbi:alpha-L-arabinofuranosidase C-terminal domain-containing protein [Demequina iriomotensis]|uniref:alpha-L-arabinofuranosidase C-terminal domain-containing protein n=1 Tax=Demequina iriomotensis TaxID=1536641 RepID=UPI000B23B943|nr:alpha-L-arabinofuranosidase C-terminal domain-containing protein [Demequina iriomotensis]